MGRWDFIVEEMFREDEGVLLESKDARIDKLPRLSPEQKEEMKAFFRKHPSLEKELDWNAPNLITYNSFRRLASRHMPMLNPDETPEFSDRRDEGDGIFSYAVPDTPEAQMAVRRAVDTHWGRGANPWCLISRFPESEDEDGELPATDEFNEWLCQKEPRLLSTDGLKELKAKGIDAGKLWEKLAKRYEKETGELPTEDLSPEDEDAGLEAAWDWWEEYSAIPKRIAFKNGKLHGFMANDEGPSMDERFPEQFEEWKRSDDRWDNDMGFEKWMNKTHPDLFYTKYDSNYKLKPGVVPEKWWNRTDSAFNSVHDF